jgi:hypothetical protein
MAALGVAVVGGALGLPEGTETGGPGARFLPAVLGGLLVLLGGAVAVRVAGRAGDGSPGSRPGGWARAGGILGALVAYTVAFERLGFPAATVLVLAALLVTHGERRAWVVVAVALAATAATYGVFAVWLKVPLPRGLLGP